MHNKSKRGNVNWHAKPHGCTVRPGCRSCVFPTPAHVLCTLKTATEKNSPGVAKRTL